MKFIFSLIISTFFFFTIQAQVKFNSIWLENPLNFEAELSNEFDYTEVPVFQLPGNGYYKALDNGYASAVISNPSQWKAGLVNIKVTQVDVVFTKYPLRKQDWLTNYHKLLAERLKALFALDPALNDSSINFRMVLQTDCKTEKQTKTFYHGIVIYFDLIEERKKEITPTRKKEILYQKSPQQSMEEDYDYVRKPQQKINIKKKEKKATPKKDCPDFSTKRRKV